MDIQLPPRIDGSPQPVLSDSRQLTIIGANGSGKSRFCDAIVASLPGKVFRMSALRALYDQVEQPMLPGSIDRMFADLNAANPTVKNLAATEFERLSHVMLAEEFLCLMTYKTNKLMKGEAGDLPATKLDTLVKVWQEVFPSNKILRENGKLLFTSDGHDDSYGATRLSNGEKAVLYYVGAVQYAMPGAVIIVDDPEIFLHRSIIMSLWNEIENMRPDCTFIYNTHDVDFATSRVDNTCIWVKAFDPEHVAWDYDVMPTGGDLSDALFIDLLGSRKPVLFIEGDAVHSIDAKLYPLVFSEYTVKPLGSCNRVIESVRTFAGLKSLHHLDSAGIVDRDRRTDREVAYLTARNIMVPNVAEVENLFLLEDVVHIMATIRNRRADRIVSRVKDAIIEMFDQQLRAQALEHLRHSVKNEVAKRIDMKFRNINALEDHMMDLINEIAPRAGYEKLCRRFHTMVAQRDYEGILLVFNNKQMINNCNVAGMLGLSGKDDYIKAVLTALKRGDDNATALRKAFLHAFEPRQTGSTS